MRLPAGRFPARECRAFALWVALLLPALAAGQQSQSLILRPKVFPPAVPEVTASCAECQPHADEHNRIAGQINALNRELAFRRREVDLQQQAVDLVASEIASLEQLPASAERDARLKFARERLEAYRAQLVQELAKVAALERQIAELERQLVAAKARLQACEAACASTAQEPPAEPPPPEPPPPEPPPAEPPPPQEIPADVRLDLRALRDALTLTDEERERRRVEAEQFDASLKSLAGDQWAAEFAAFFTSTLFDPDTPFDTAFLANMQTLQQLRELTPEQRAAQSARALQNVTVWAQQAKRDRAALAAQGRHLEYVYTRDARGLIGPGYPDLPVAGESHKTAALMAQDAHMGQLLQFRAGLNLITIGDGTVTTGGFTTLTGQQSFARLTQINHEIGTLRATGGDADRIAALEAERTTLLTIDGVAPSEGLMTARSGLIDGLAGLSADVYWAYWRWIEFKEQFRIIEFRDGVEVRVNWRGTPEQYQAELRNYEARYYAALSQSPFLGAMVDPTGSGDLQPFWQYLTGDGRTPELDQQALTQGIDFLDTATAQVIDQFGTIVTTVPLLDAYGSPVFAPLRSQVVTQLTPIYPQISVNMDSLTSLYDANLAANALSRTATDVAIGFVQIVVGGVIVFVPVTAPVLVPVEIALTTGQVGLEGIRTYYAWQDLQRAEQAAAAGSGASYVGTMPYRDLFDAQLGTFILVGATAPISYAGSVMSLNVARAQVQAGEIAVFQALSPGEQVSFIRGLPEDVRGQYVSQLDRTHRTLFAIAWEQDALNTQMIRSVRESDDWLEWVNGSLQPLSDATRNLPDQAILDRLSPYAATRDQLVLSPDARRRYFEEDIGTDEVGPFSTVPPLSNLEGAGEGTFPAPGHYTADMSRAEIDALISKPGPLTAEETALKADLLLRGFGLEREAVPGWNAPAQPAPEPLNPFGIDSSVGTQTFGDTSMSGATEVIPGRPRNPNRTALLDEPDLPPETLILDPFIPPAAGLLDFPLDLDRLLQGDMLPINIWTGGTPRALGVREPRPFTVVPPTAGTLAEAPAAPAAIAAAPNAAPSMLDDLDGDTLVGGPRGGTIVHVIPEAAPSGAPAAPSPWVPFVVKMFPIGCRYLAGGPPSCESPTYVFVLQYPQSQAGTIAGSLRQTPGVVYVEGDAMRRVQAADPYLASRGSWGQSYDDQWALKQIGMAAGPAATAPASGAPVTVAVIDTGVAWNHVDLGPDQLWVNPREAAANGKDDDANGYVDDVVGWNFIDRNNLPWDFNGHGTLVAGIIASSRDNGAGIAGVNPGARIMVLKAMDEKGRGPASAVAEAIVYAASNGARVINLSAGGRMLTRTEYLAIEFAWSRGAVVVVAAGNEGIDLTDYGPGGLPRALTVTATDTADRRVAESNFGANIDLAAPGVDVLGPRAIGTDLLVSARARNYHRGANVVGPDAGYIRATGTSFAAPLVAGTASLLLAANPALSPLQVERMLLHSARDIEAPGVDHLTGYGRLDATAALAADPAFFVEANIARVAAAMAGQEQVLEVFGTADADRLQGARLEYAAGENPGAWKRAGAELRAPLRDALLGRIPASELRTAPVWTLRIVAMHANGRERESRFRLALK